MNIVLFGPPGAGKGTQAENLVNEFNFFRISTGDLLRTEIENKTPLSSIIKDAIDKGLFVSDEIINEIIEKILSNKKYFNRLTFDGYPRNLNQGNYLDLLIKKYNQKISCVLSLKVDQDVIIKRIIGRQVCSRCKSTFNEFFNPATKLNHSCDSKFLKKRSDDNEDTIKNRINTYEEETIPVLGYYKNQDLLYEIDGMGKISTIYKEIHRIIQSLGT